MLEGVTKTKLPSFTSMGSVSGTVHVDANTGYQLTVFDNLEPNTLHNVICRVGLKGGDTIQYNLIGFGVYDYGLKDWTAESLIPVRDWIGVNIYSVEDTLTFVTSGSGARVDIFIHNWDSQAQDYYWWCERFMIETP